MRVISSRCGKTKFQFNWKESKEYGGLQSDRQGGSMGR